MKTKPKTLVYIAALLVAIALGLPLQIIMLYEHGLDEMSSVLAKLAPLNWIILFAAPATAALVYRASPWSILAVPALTGVILHNNWFVAEMATDYPPLLVGVSSGMFLFAMSSLFRKEVLQLFINPERRWWLTPFRHRASVPIRIGRNGAQIYTNTFDISKGGMFIEMPKTDSLLLFNPDLRDLSPGSRCTVCVSLSRSGAIECHAEVVRNTPARGEYPAGIALRFVDLNRYEQRALHGFLKRLEPTAAH